MVPRSRSRPPTMAPIGRSATANTRSHPSRSACHRSEVPKGNSEPARRASHAWPAHEEAGRTRRSCLISQSRVVHARCEYWRRNTQRSPSHCRTTDGYCSPRFCLSESWHAFRLVLTLGRLCATHSTHTEPEPWALERLWRAHHAQTGR